MSKAFCLTDHISSTGRKLIDRFLSLAILRNVNQPAFLSFKFLLKIFRKYGFEQLKYY